MCDVSTLMDFHQTLTLMYTIMKAADEDLLGLKHHALVLSLDVCIVHCISQRCLHVSTVISTVVYMYLPS